MFFWLYLALASGGYIAFYKWTADLFNPAGIFLFFWYFCCALSNLYLSDLQNIWPVEMHVACICSGFTFAFGAAINYPAKKLELLKKVHTTNVFWLLSRGMFAVAFICFLIEWRHNGFTLTVLAVDTADLKGANEGLPFIHYGTILLPVSGVMAIYELLNDGPKVSVFVIMFVVFVLYSFGFGLSRGDLLLYIGAALYLVSRYKRVRLFRMLLYAGLIFSLVVGIMLLRISNEDSIVYSTTDNKILSIFYSYIALNYQNLLQLMNSHVDYHWAGNASLRVIWTATGQKDRFPIVNFDTADVFNAQTYLYPYYHDYKMWGVLIFPFLIGCGLGFLYKVTFYTKNAYYIIVMALLQKAIYFSFFGDYFISDLVIIWPYMVAAVIGWFSKWDVVFSKKAVA